MVTVYVPNGLLSRLLGDRMYSVEFVLDDYVQFKFDGALGRERGGGTILDMPMHFASLPLAL